MMLNIQEYVSLRPKFAFRLEIWHYARLTNIWFSCLHNSWCGLSSVCLSKRLDNLNMIRKVMKDPSKKVCVHGVSVNQRNDDCSFYIVRDSLFLVPLYGWENMTLQL